MRIKYLACVVSFVLIGCATHEPVSDNSSIRASALPPQTGQVTNVKDMTRAGGPTTGIGSFAGGLLGGLAGGTIGSGNGSTIAAIGGGLAGSIAGNRIEQAGSASRMSEVTILFTDGVSRTYSIPADETLRTGDVVTVTSDNGKVRITR